MASKVEHHGELCLKRLEAKNKTDLIDKKFMELSHRITNEISGITKAKVSSAVVKKRSLLGVPTSNKNLPINSPLITNRGINRLQDLSNAMAEQNKMSTPSLPARSGGLNLVKDGQFQMNRIIRKDMPPTKNETKQNTNDDWQRPFQIRSIESKEKDSLALKKPPLPKEKAEQKSESKINTTMETTPDITEGTLRRLNFTDNKEEEEKVVPPKLEEKKTDTNLNVFDRLSIPEGNVGAN